MENSTEMHRQPPKRNGLDPEREIQQAVTNATLTTAVQTLERRVGRLENFIIATLIGLVINLGGLVLAILKIK